MLVAFFVPLFTIQRVRIIEVRLYTATRTQTTRHGSSGKPDIHIFRSSFFLSKSSLCMLSYISMILPYLNYCNLVWETSYTKKNLQRIVSLQKRVIRIVNKSNYDAHTHPIFKNPNLLKFLDKNLVQLGQFMFAFKNSIFPPLIIVNTA